MEIKLTVQPDGNWRIEWPQDRPVVTIAALEGAIAVVKQMAAQREMRPAVEQASPAALARLLNGRG